MTAIERLERREARSEATIAHVQALLRALDNDPKRWRYDGEVIDFGAGADAHCACGHAIRYGHPLYHVDQPDRVVILGCICVSQYEAIDPVTAARMQADFAVFQAKVREAKKLAAQTAKLAEVAAAIEVYEAAKARVVALRRYYQDRDGWIPPGLWSGRIPPRREYKAPAAALRYYQGAAEYLQEIARGYNI